MARSKPRKLAESNNPRANPDGTPYQALIALPHGARAPRCQATRRDGFQCAQPARTGFRVCQSHGAGSRKREQEGTRKPVAPGRPVQHGLYSASSKKKLENLQAEIREVAQEFHAAEDELVLLRAVIRLLVGRDEVFAEKLDRLEQLIDTFTNASDRCLVWVREHPGLQAEPDPALMREARDAARLVPEARRLARDLQGWIGLIGTNVVRVSRVQKAHAETRVKLSEARVLEQFIVLVRHVREIMRDLVDVGHMRTFEDRVRREILAPNRAPKGALPPLRPVDPSDA